MIGRPVAAFLLIFVITVAGVGGMPARGDDSPPVETNETKLTPEEELEARSVAEQFARRLEHSDDLVSIVDDLYVKDFAERLGHEPADRFLLPVAWELASQVKGNELSRYHIAELKFGYLFLMLCGAWHYTHLPNKNEEPQECEKELTPEEVFPPRVIALFKDDPALAELLIEESKKSEESENTAQTSGGSEEQAIDDDESKKKKAEDNDLTIKSIERLRDFVSKLEQIVAILDEHLRSLPVPQTLQHMMESVCRSDQETDLEPRNLRAIILAGNHLGAPEGTRLICVNVLAFHIDMIRADGQLKILNVYVDDD